jgi:Co/Zn/Cd efflux system component
MVRVLNHTTGKTKQELLSQRRQAHCLLVLGIIVIKAAYVRLLMQDPSASTNLPLMVSLVGFLIASLGFNKFAGYQHQQRQTFCLTQVPAEEANRLAAGHKLLGAAFSRN